jgi:hypothetical protein
MNYNKYSEEEITEIVENIQETMENPVQYIDTTYDEIMFLVSIRAIPYCPPKISI